MFSIGERLDDLGESFSTAGNLALNSTVGTMQGILMGSWPLFLVGVSVGVAVLIIRIPRRWL